jgi:hypothetical protein
VRFNPQDFPDASAVTKAIRDAIIAAFAGEKPRSHGPPEFDISVVGPNGVVVVEWKTPVAKTTNLRASIVTRTQRWVAGSLDRMSDEEVLKLVEAQSPAETIAELLVATPETLRVQDSDWTELLLRGADAKSQIAELAGGLLSPLEAARVLKITVPGVKQRLERRKLLAVPLPGGQRGFPARQFQEDGRVRDGVPAVAAAGAHLDPWTLLSILVDEVEDPTGGTLLERLGDETVRADVLSRLSSYGEHAAA